jgi:hypothetical protein
MGRSEPSEEELCDARTLSVKKFVEKYNCSKSKYYKLKLNSGARIGKRKIEEMQEESTENQDLIELASNQPFQEQPLVSDQPQLMPSDKITSFEFDFSTVENVQAPVQEEETHVPYNESIFSREAPRENFVSAPSGLHAMNPPPEADEETRVILSKLRMYYCFFGDMLCDRVIPANAAERTKWLKSLPSRSKDDLLVIYHEVVSVINSNNSFMLAKNGYLSFCHLFELIAPFVGGDLEGFSVTMSLNKDVDDILKQIVIENFESFSSFLTPKSRLIAATAQGALKCNSYNQAVRVRKEQIQKEKEDLTKMDEDLPEEKAEIPT